MLWVHWVTSRFKRHCCSAKFMLQVEATWRYIIAFGTLIPSSAGGGGATVSPLGDQCSMFLSSHATHSHLTLTSSLYIMHVLYLICHYHPSHSLLLEPPYHPSHSPLLPITHHTPSSLSPITLPPPLYHPSHFPLLPITHHTPPTLSSPTQFHTYRSNEGPS